MNQALRVLLATVAVFGCTVAQAHPGHDLAAAGFVAGLLHPLLGMDHLLAMLVVGIWAAQMGDAARWWVPASFVGVMALGGVLALQGFVPPSVEPGIAVSLLVLGLLVVLAARLPLIAAMTITGIFAIFHGAAHGLELPAAASPARYAIGFLVATAALHGVGLVLGALRPTAARLSARIAGGAAIATGVVAGLVQVLA